MITTANRPRRRLPRPVAIAVAVLAVAIVIGALAFVGTTAAGLIASWSAHPPSEGTVILAPSDSKAAQAAASEQAGSDAQRAAQYLSEQPTAYWLTPEADPAATVWNRVTDLAAQARDQHAALAIVVYGLPRRDCGNQSAGGVATDDDYAEWTARIGQALRNAADLQRIVILEPDSLALAPDCANIDQRASELRRAIDNLAGTDIWIYLDGGHSDWRPPEEMAGLIRAVGLDKVRGFATNVSNYNSDADEIAYAHALSGLLDATHAVVDTSRNGAGAGSTWCNPSGRRVGDHSGSFSDDVVDTNLWIKPPGESDGACNGGPSAGTWWPEAAVELTADARK